MSKSRVLFTISNNFNNLLNLWNCRFAERKQDIEVDIEDNFSWHDLFSWPVQHGLRFISKAERFAYEDEKVMCSKLQSRPCIYIYIYIYMIYWRYSALLDILDHSVNMSHMKICKPTPFPYVHGWHFIRKMFVIACNLWRKKKYFF